MKKLLLLVTSLLLTTSLVACSTNTNNEVQPTPTPVITSGTIENFNGEIEGKSEENGTSYTDTYSFVGETTDNIITSLEFDIIRNKGTELEVDKKDIMGDDMNISEAIVSLGEAEALTLDKLSVTGYDQRIPEGLFVVTGSIDELSHDTTLSELTFQMNYTKEATMDEVLIAFEYVAKENNISLSKDTKVVELLPIYNIEVTKLAIQPGEGRISFTGSDGGRSFGEQIDVLVKYILDNKMTLEQVVTLFKTENQGHISERNTIPGCSILFTPEFAAVVESAMGIKQAEDRVVDVYGSEDGSAIAVISVKGYEGEVLADVIIKDGKIQNIIITSYIQVEENGKALIEDGSEFINSLLTNQDNLDSISLVEGAEATSTALINIAKLARGIVESK